MMNSLNSTENEFLTKLTEITEQNITNPQFGVSMLARELGVSRSNLHRKVNSIAKISASQFINQVRLKSAMEMLRQTSFTVSEVAYKTGFSNTSYFIKCFHDYYGYTPGEVGSRDSDESNSIDPFQSRKKRLTIIAILVTFVVVLTVILLIVFKPFSAKQNNHKKSIAILPFTNDSNDSTNVYLINGLMESINNNLSKIKDLRVISRTSVEKYRDNPKLIREIAKELNVNYLVEGSGQKYGNEIFLSIQLIDATNDMHLWSKQYERNCEDIINLQIEVAKNIAKEIQVVITPEENTRIEQIPTENRKAYNYYLKGMDLLKEPDTVVWCEAISYFRQAIEEDNTFVLAYAEMALVNLYIYHSKGNKNDSNLFLANRYADKALLYNNKSARALIAKGVYYYVLEEYEVAISYLNEALKYNPNSSGAIRLLAVIYSETGALPNAEKYLTYSIKGVDLNAPIGIVEDRSIRYGGLGNTFRNSGFFAEAKKSYNKALELNYQNVYAACGLAHLNNCMYIPFERKEKYLEKLMELDSTSIGVLRICGLTYYWERDYKNAFHYFERIVNFRGSVFLLDQGRMAQILLHLGKPEESKEYMKLFSEFVENSNDMTKCRLSAAIYAHNGDTSNAIKQMRIFSKQEGSALWMIRVAKTDPLYDNIRQMPEFKEIISELETKFWKNHKRVRASLEEKGLL